MITGQLAEAVITDKAAGVAARLCGPALALVTSAASLAHHGYLGQVANMCRYVYEANLHAMRRYNILKKLVQLFVA